ncbi:MAG: helix-turn-helix domain-containing protein [Pseudorhizobium sp.]
MSISINNFEPAGDKNGAAVHVAAAVAEARQAVGYTVEQLALTTGLTVDELNAIENGEGVEPSLLQRVATGLGLPAAAFLAP